VAAGRRPPTSLKRGAGAEHHPQQQDGASERQVADPAELLVALRAVENAAERGAAADAEEHGQIVQRDAVVEGGTSDARQLAGHHELRHNLHQQHAHQDLAPILEIVHLQGVDGEAEGGPQAQRHQVQDVVAA